MASREKARRHWPLAVTMSIVLHGAIVLGLALLAGRADVEGRTPSKPEHLPFTFVDSDAEGGISFEAPREPGLRPARPEKMPTKSTQKASPATALLRDPWTDGAAKGVDSVGSQMGSNGPAASGSADKPTTSFFNVPAHGRRIVYVLDISASMGANAALAKACRELQESLQKLASSARFQVIVYNSQARNLLPRFAGWLEPTPSLVHDAGAALERLVAEGGTNHEPALRMALALRPDVIFLLTDADDLTPAQVRLVNTLNQRRAIVHTIELTTRNRERAWMPLQVLARENGGMYQGVDLER